MNARVCARRIVRDCAWLALLPGAVLAGAADDIRDIRGPKTVSVAWAVYAIVTAIVAAICIAYIIWRRRHRAAQPRPLTLSEQALQRLESTRPLMQTSTARAFGIAASEVIRDYVERRFAVVVTQRTTEEFLQALLQSSNDALVCHRPLLAEFLQQCDFVKFAGRSLAAANLESLFKSARRFVLETGEVAVVA
jgi:hypothetical protein